jgi:hypothetical protein
MARTNIFEKNKMARTNIFEKNKMAHTNIFEKNKMAHTNIFKKIKWPARTLSGWVAQVSLLRPGFLLATGPDRNTQVSKARPGPTQSLEAGV